MKVGLGYLKSAVLIREKNRVDQEGKRVKAVTVMIFLKRNENEN